ncbi:hypothetical protein [Magpiepox virus 2]|nr:hypothetical protein [Magpiepox virus 2]
MLNYYLYIFINDKNNTCKIKYKIISVYELYNYLYKTTT